jgi:tetratricopeptide (TPR) repeat protein
VGGAVEFTKIAVGIFSGLMLVSNIGQAQEAAGRHAGSGETSPAQTQPGIKAGTAAYEKLLHDADELIKHGKPAEAYALLEPFEFQLSGAEQFDYLLGIAALDSGKPAKATLVFERVLTANPNFIGARLEMARAYYQLGDVLRAKTEFETVLQQNPSEGARVTIRKYLDAIAARDPGKATRITGYVAATAGRDTNVNNSTDQSQIFIPSIVVVATLSPTNVRVADDYYGVAAGSEVVHRLDPNWGLYLGADLFRRSYFHQTAFDSLGADGRAGVMYGDQADRFRAGLLGGADTLGGSRYLDTSGVNAAWGHTFSPSNQLNVFGQYLQYRYANVALQPNDFNQQAVGTGWVHVLADGRSLMSGSVYYGTETDVGGRVDGGKRFDGLRVGVQASCSDTVVAFANAGWQTGNYSKVNPFFLTQRTDRLYDLTLGTDWHFDKLWALRPQVSYTRNNSNIVIYSYNRTDLSVTLRRDFR